MPIWEFKCTECGKTFDSLWQTPLDKTKEPSAVSPCCNADSPKANNQRYSFGIKMGGSRKIDQRAIKKAKKDGNPDGGIPFGSVPGDEDYRGLGGSSPGDIDYRGPLP